MDLALSPNHLSHSLRWPVVTIRIGVTALLLGALTQRVHADDSAENLGVRVPEGFEMTLFAGEDLANDIHAMTIDSLGRVVVAGPGYVRILVDQNKDGKADSVRQFVDGPANGAQGLYFWGRDLFCVGDEGLLRYRDQNGDDRADGPPEVFLKIKTGGEHHAHAIRRGPDGWWYLIAGNDSQVTREYATLNSSPIKQPHAGTVLRLKPDMSGGEIYCDGIRNAYDFTFNTQGDIFVWDSDDEREVSMPWYEPTSLFHMTPASDAGWVSKSLRRPKYFVDMPSIVGQFGRGSPTGVLCYRHEQFPAQYSGALFLLDWTFGRIVALPMKRAGASWTSQPIDFMKSVGELGFAPTDAEVGPDGSLFVSVGGRGTRGSVYRVSYSGWDKSKEPAPAASTNEKLLACLDALQPDSSWSRVRWTAQARELGADPFIEASLDSKKSVSQRVRAIEVATELFGGLDAATVAKLAKAEAPEVRARAIWSYGRTQTAPQSMVVVPFLSDADPLVVRCALESLLGAPDSTQFDRILPLVAKCLSNKDRVVRQTAARVAGTLPKATFNALTKHISPKDGLAIAMLTFGRIDLSAGPDINAVKSGLSVLRAESDATVRLQTIRMMQMALGDVGPRAGIAPVFDGYSPRYDLTQLERALDPVRIELMEYFPSGEHVLDLEVSRLLAMLSLSNGVLVDRLLEQINDKTSPVDDLHYLIVIARTPVERTADQRSRIASALVKLEVKIAAGGLKQDSNWDDRLTELYTELVKYDSLLPAEIVAQPDFGLPGHVLYLSPLPPEQLQTAIDKFAQRIKSDENYQWSTDVAFTLEASSNPEHLQMIREQYDNFAMRGAVLMILSEEAQESDRAKFVEGLDASQLEVLDACINGLEKLPSNTDAPEQFALLRTVRRLGNEAHEHQIRERIIKRLQQNCGEDFGFVIGEPEPRPQTDAIAKCTAWLTEKYPEQAAIEFGSAQSELEALASALSAVDWDHGKSDHGEAVFNSRSCAQCHSGRQALGPDLAGAAMRFSREDLFTAITLPNRDVSPRYQTTMVETKSGKVYSGAVIYESVDGVILRDATGKTFRIEGHDIESQRKLNTSLMPAGLLKGLKPNELADLYAYMRSLTNTPAPLTAADAGK